MAITIKRDWVGTQIVINVRKEEYIVLQRGRRKTITEM